MSELIDVLDKMRANLADGIPFNRGIAGADLLYEDLSKCYVVRTHVVNGETVPAPLSYLPAPSYFFINSSGAVTRDSNIRSHDVTEAYPELNHTDTYRIRTGNVFKSKHDAMVNLLATMK
jgi:hypothetical protein